MIQLYNGDCLEAMKYIPEHSVDMILTDLPYGTTSCKWDNIIPFEPMWEQINRVIKDNGAICLFGSEPFSSALRMSNIKNYKYDWIWEKQQGTGGLHSKNMPMKKHENISVFSLAKIGHKKQLGGKRMIYYPQGLISCNKIQKHGNWGMEKTMERKSQKNEIRVFFENYPTSILKYNRDKDRVHPTQKPVALMEYLIKTYTQENETVLDFTMGSGSTGVACKLTNRNFIGIELDKHYFDIAEQRINNGYVLDNEKLKEELNNSPLFSDLI